VYTNFAGYRYYISIYHTSYLHRHITILVLTLNITIPFPFSLKHPKHDQHAHPKPTRIISVSPHLVPSHTTIAIDDNKKTKKARDS
jgi:hypothetical protein